MERWSPVGHRHHQALAESLRIASYPHTENVPHNRTVMCAVRLTISEPRLIFQNAARDYNNNLHVGTLRQCFLAHCKSHPFPARHALQLNRITDNALSEIERFRKTKGYTRSRC